MSPKGKKKPESFEERLARLEELVVRLEAGNLPLESAVASFEEGMALAKGLAASLDNAEKRIETLLVADDGRVTKEPFDFEPADEAAGESGDDGGEEEEPV
jgi:exodeoxyribonuclease VII small subunit